MIAKTDSEIEILLQQYKNFSECVIEEISFLDFNISLRVVFDYIWTADGLIREDPTPAKSVTLKFNLVQEIHLLNHLNAAISAESGRVNWGINEVAMVVLSREENHLEPYKFLPVQFHHVAFLWEGERRIDIVFSTLEVFER